MIAAAALAPLILALGIALTATGSGALDPPPALGSVLCLDQATPGTPATPPVTVVAGVTLDAEQWRNARTIRDVGIALGIPTQGLMIAIATAMTESGMRNLAYGDADSLGLFQQRPSAGWGTPEEIQDPVRSSTSFFRALQKIPNWEELPLTVAAQQVQRSAYPDRYAVWEPLAGSMIVALSRVEVLCAALDVDTPLDGDITAHLPPGFTLPATTPIRVAIAIHWALAQLGTPYHFGGDCTDAHSGIPARQCDCSSLVQQAYRAAGIILTRTTHTQIREGTPIPDVAHLLPGDLIFLPGHVGIYLGSGLVLHAPHTGDVVKISELEPYWTSHWVAARRVPVTQ
ncbi:MAG: C40 family peptidase [Actinomycetales bacterium]|nr:C40 family peptidase [Actinomycetales bacterium]